jgi:hypothetical protein
MCRLSQCRRYFNRPLFLGTGIYFNCLIQQTFFSMTIGGEDSGRKTRSKIEEGTHGSWNWEEVLKQNPETALRGKKDEEDEGEEDRLAAALAQDFEGRQLSTLENPTPEMCRIMALIMEVDAQRRAMSLKDQLAEFNKQRKAELQAKFSSQDLTPNELTPAMQEVIIQRLFCHSSFFMQTVSTRISV